MKYTHEQEQKFKNEFAVRRKKQLIATAPVLLAVAAIGLADESTATTLGGVPLSIALPIAIAVVIGAVIFALSNWRCPACNGYLGKAFNPKFCSKCGVALR